ncbi:lactate utilization protein [Selenomonas sputigena]|uniref:Lactate utilization protein n=1 Tax=Selenomonas sputigena TaxID=69823 RepID=A0ABV3X564_9FIRM
MLKVCQNWPKEAFDDELINAKYWDDFEKNATLAAAEVFRVKDYAEAKAKTAELIKEFNCKKVIATGGADDPEIQKIYDELSTPEVPIYTEKFELAENAPTADLGLSVAEFGVGETGGVCVDTYSYEARVTGMLPPVHAVYVNANYMTENLTTALKIIARVYKRGYVGFITGPSRTADIERVLTLGVHGPSRFFVIAIENMKGSEG